MTKAMVKSYEVRNYMSNVAPVIEGENRMIRILSGCNSAKELEEKFYKDFYSKMNNK